MSPSHEEALFTLALAKKPAERAEFLDRECGGDHALRQRLEALLAAQEQPGAAPGAESEADRPTLKADSPNAPDEAIGQLIGHYKVLQKIGEGGCGAVYMAEQTEPVRRRVALKVIKLGMDTKATEGRLTEVTVYTQLPQFFRFPIC